MKKAAASFRKPITEHIKTENISAIVLKKGLWRRHFPLNFAKFLKMRFLQNTSEQLILCNV